MPAQAPPGPAATTPCIGVCQAPAGVCLGCRRTLAEIAAWPRLSEAERRRIMRELPGRPPPPAS
jgi:predicted Fe-S protein YdhL (DUF1289 family)